MRVAIYVRGGNVCEVLSDNPEIIVTIVDFDNIAEGEQPYDADVDIVEDISKEVTESVQVDDSKRVQHFRAVNAWDAS